MPQPYGQAVLTDKGEELLAKSSAGQCLIEYVCMAIGDGRYSAEEKQQIELKKRVKLKGEKNRYAFSRAVLENNTVRLTALLTNQDPVTSEGLVTEGYYINEVGIYAKEQGADNNTAVLYSICLTASDIGVGDYMPTYAGHNRAEITQDYLLHIGDNTNITVNVIGAVALAEDVRECRNEMNSHILDKNNPHKTTKVQIGLEAVDNTSDKDKPVSTAQQAAIDAAYQQSTAYADLIVNALINGAPGDLDTIGELAQAMENNKDVVTVLRAAIGSKADQAELDGHMGNNTIHVTATERQKWNNGSANYGTCSTAAAIVAKTAELTGFVLVTGATVKVKFTVTNTAANPTLNVNSTGAKPIYYRGAAITAGYLAANRTYEFVYNGTQYELVGDIDTNTTYSNMTAATANAAGRAGLVPAPAAGAQAKYLRGDGTWQTPPDTNTTYSDFVKSGSGAKAGLVPAPSTTAGTTKYLREDGTWAVPPDTNTTYSNMTAATANAAGRAGLVPAPAAGAQAKYLRGDGTWQTPPDTNTTYTPASAIPKEAGTAAVGTSTKYAREDHVHPMPTTVSDFESITFSNSCLIRQRQGSTAKGIAILPTSNNGIEIFNNYLGPYSDNVCTLGMASYRFKQLYAGTTTIATSDRNQKDDITPISDKYIELFMKLQPVSFIFKDNTSGRTHIGFISQDIEDAMAEVGLTSLDFAGFCKDKKQKTVRKMVPAYDEEGNEILDGEGNIVTYEADTQEDELDENGNVIWIYSLRYSEFIALNTAMIQRQQASINRLEESIDNLERKITALEKLTSKDERIGNLEKEIEMLKDSLKI